MQVFGRVIVVLIFAGWTFFVVGCGPPSDEVMERTFRENQKAFEELRRLVMEDSSVGILLGVSEDRTEPDVEEAFRRGLTEARLKTYHGLLGRLHLRGVSRGGNDVVFQAYYSGSEERGYVYSEEAPAGLVKKPAYLGEAEYSTKFLRDHWFLYYSHE